MRHRVQYKVLHAGLFKAATASYDLASEFLATLEPHQVVAVTVTPEHEVIVWYRDR